MQPDASYVVPDPQVCKGCKALDHRKREYADAGDKDLNANVWAVLPRRRLTIASHPAANRPGG